MKTSLRLHLNRFFTAGALLSVFLIVIALIAILLPILWRGAGAVVFQGTVEFRRFQAEQFGRGDNPALQEEIRQTAAVRDKAFRMLEDFALTLDTAGFEKQARQTHRAFQSQLAQRGLSDEAAGELELLSKQLREGLIAAAEADDQTLAMNRLDEVLGHAGDTRLSGTAAEGYFELARRYRLLVAGADLSRRAEFAGHLTQVKQALAELLGPAPDSPTPALLKDRYGATRWDRAKLHLDRLLWAQAWQPAGPNQALRMVRTPMEKVFSGTELAGLFPYVRENVQGMLHPRWTIYWQYFVDDNLMSSHYFGGVGPEILGTILLAVLSIALAMPLGIAAAAWQVECAKDTLPLRVLRTCVNTLAGVPSIVFGLFGMAFFMLWFLPGGPILNIGPIHLNWPGFGMKADRSIIAGSLTLALLVLPVVIRASEEAIRSVPRDYREASLSLGASQFKCFISVTLPAALPGILTGLILSMSRAAGETAPILFTAAVAMGEVPTYLTQPTRTLSYGSYDMAVGDKMASLAPHNQFGMVMTLVVVVLILNLAAIIVRGRISRRLSGR